MASEQPRSQRQLIEDTAVRVEQIADVASDLRADLERRLRQAEVTAEATALARCIEALQALSDLERRSSASYADVGYTRTLVSGSFASVQWGPGERILRFLADRFGVNLFEIHDVQCTRRHVEDVSADELLAALRTAR